jgi:hypothetical protein
VPVNPDHDLSRFFVDGDVRIVRDIFCSKWLAGSGRKWQGLETVEGGGWKVEGGGWKVEGGGWKVEGGGWKVEGFDDLVIW